MDDVLVLKAAYHVDDGVHFPDVAQELVAQTFALGCAFYQSGDVHELQGSRGELVRLVHFSQLVQTCVRHRDDAYIFFNGAERIVCRLCACICQGVEQGAFAHVGQPNHT